jgi:hypothetical protein
MTDLKVQVTAMKVQNDNNEDADNRQRHRRRPRHHQRRHLGLFVRCRTGSERLGASRCMRWRAGTVRLELIDSLAYSLWV